MTDIDAEEDIVPEEPSRWFLMGEFTFAHNTNPTTVSEYSLKDLESAAPDNKYQGYGAPYP